MQETPQSTFNLALAQAGYFTIQNCQLFWSCFISISFLGAVHQMWNKLPLHANEQMQQRDNQLSVNKLTVKMVELVRRSVTVDCHNPSPNSRSTSMTAIKQQPRGNLQWAIA